jgi:hypothetical protein
MTAEQVTSAVTRPAYGLFPAIDFTVTTGERVKERAGDGGTPVSQALWLFRGETIAVPKAGRPVAGFDPALSADEDLRRWSAATVPGGTCEYPTLVWVGAPDVLEHGRLDAAGESVRTASVVTRIVLVPRLASNRSFYNEKSTAFFCRRDVRLRGTFEEAGGAPRFRARTFWPEDFCLDRAAPLTSIPATAGALRDFVRARGQPGGRGGFSAQVAWQRESTAAHRRGGRPVIALMLNGAQGDDDEAHGGHFALVTGRVGEEGQIHDWLVANYYALDRESEKGILAAMSPMENYLGDLNSGQSWYRPSWLLVATLRDERTAAHLCSALGRVFNQFYRHPFQYHHATGNCTGISISLLRTLGWNVPALGASSWVKAVLGLPVVAASARSLDKGRTQFDYFSEERTRLLPALAFEQAGADLMQLVAGTPTRKLTAFEGMLRSDVEEIILMRIPQFPSSRVRGDYPVASLEEYLQRMPPNPADRQIIPLDPRPFPATLNGSVSSGRKRRRSDYAVTAYAGVAIVCAGLIVRSLWRRYRRGNGAAGGARDG